MKVMIRLFGYYQVEFGLIVSELVVRIVAGGST